MLSSFMESGIRDSDYVIMICTPKYAKKANEREGGVGIENTIITGEYYDKKKGRKMGDNWSTPKELFQPFKDTR